VVGSCGVGVGSGGGWGESGDGRGEETGSSINERIRHKKTGHERETGDGCVGVKHGDIECSVEGEVVPIFLVQAGGGRVVGLRGTIVGLGLVFAVVVMQ
jgi:hypothetical protein